MKSQAVSQAVLILRLSLWLRQPTAPASGRDSGNDGGRGAPHAVRSVGLWRGPRRRSTLPPAHTIRTSCGLIVTAGWTCASAIADAVLPSALK